MRRYLLSLAALALWAVPSSGQDCWAACRVAVEERPGVYATGSGTPVAAEGGKTLILTAAHVVPAHLSDRPASVSAGGKTYPARYVAGAAVSEAGPGLIRVDGPDLAILEVDADLGGVCLAGREPAPGEAVYQYGFGGAHPAAAKPVLRRGVATANRITRATLTTTVPSVQGDSGCGVFNEAGELVGVCWGRNEAVQCAESVTTVKTFLASASPKRFPKLRAWLDARRHAAAAPVPKAEPKKTPTAPPPAPKADPKVPAVIPGPVVIGYERRKVCDGRRCYEVLVPVYGPK